MSRNITGEPTNAVLNTASSNNTNDGLESKTKASENKQGQMQKPLESCKAMQRLTQIWKSKPNCRVDESSTAMQTTEGTKPETKFLLCPHFSADEKQDKVSSLCSRYKEHITDPQNLTLVLSRDIYESIQGKFDIALSSQMNGESKERNTLFCPNFDMSRALNENTNSLIVSQ